MESQIRLASKSDYESLAKFISDDVAWNRYGIDYQEALKLISTAEDDFYVVENGEGVIGFCAVRLNGVGNIGAYIRMIFVDWHYRCQGFGKQLLEHVGKIIVKQIPNIFLICSIDNTKAQKFYEREGFKRVGIMKDLVKPGHDEILYWKSAGSLR